MKKLFFLILFFGALQCWAQCGPLSIYFPPRAEADSVKVIEVINKSEAAFFITEKSDIVYVYSGQLGASLTNCGFLASAPVGNLNLIKSKLNETGGEISFLKFNTQTFHCEDQWKYYFNK